MRTCLGRFLCEKNPFLKHNNSSNRSKTKTPIIANSWNYHICEAPRTTASFPPEARKIRSHSVDEFGPFLQCWDFSKNFRSWQVDVWDSDTRLVCCVDSYTLCLQSAIIPLSSDCSPLIFSLLWCSALALAGGRAVPIFCCMCTHILLMTINISLQYYFNFVFGL